MQISLLHNTPLYWKRACPSNQTLKLLACPLFSLEENKAVAKKSGTDCRELSRFNFSQSNGTCNSSMVLGEERIRIEVLKGPYSWGRPFRVWMIRSSLSTEEETAAKVSEICLSFLIYSVMDWLSFLIFWRWVYNWMVWERDNEANRCSRASQTYEGILNQQYEQEFP